MVRDTTGICGCPYSELFRLLYSFLNEIMSNGDALSWLNALIMQLTGLQLDEEGGYYLVAILFVKRLIYQSVD